MKREKKTPLPIIIDTREQTPMLFAKQVIAKDATTEIKKLDTGDYSVAGYEDRICLERKSLSDWVGTVMSLFKGDARFRNELERMTRIKYRCIMIEGSRHEIYDKNYIGEVHPHSIIGQELSIIQRHQIPVFYLSNPHLQHYTGRSNLQAENENFAFGWMKRAYQEINK